MGITLAAALTACSGGDEPPPITSTKSSTGTVSGSSRSTTTTPAPATRTVVVPPEATKHTEAGAKAFVTYFVEQMSTSAYEADSSIIGALSGPRCKGCGTLIDFADELKAKGQHVDRQSVQLRGQIVMPNSRPDRYIIDALIEDRPSRIVDSQGKTVSNESGEKFTLRSTVSWSADAWVMDENLLVTN
jgi:hypothetical protein